VRESKSLSAIKQSIDLGEIRNVDELRWQFALLFANLAMAHASNSEVCFILKYLKHLFSQGQVLRRERSETGVTI
jgi:hypothetical protein